MSELKKIIQSIVLPVQLSEEVFLLFGKKRRIPDFELMVGHLPKELKMHLDHNATVSSGGTGTYLLPLVEGRFLRIKVDQQAIVEVSESEF